MLPGHLTRFPVFLFGVVVCAWLLQTSHASGQLTNAYRLRQWTAEHGLPNNTIKCLLQTRDGYLWAGTMFGLVRFDGVHFRVLDQGNLPAFENGSDSINDLVQDCDGALWIATLKGLVRNVDGEFTTFTRADGLPSNKVMCLALSRSGGLWVGTEAGLGLFRDGQFVRHSRWPTLTDTAIWKVAEDASGTLWVGHPGGVMQFSSDTGQAGTNESHLSSVNVSAMHRDGQGRVWIASSGTRDVFCVSNYQVIRWELPMDSPENPEVTALFEGTDFQIYAHLKKYGLLRLGRSGFELVQTDPLLSRTKMESGLMDAEGNLWLGARHEGLLRLQKKSIKTFFNPDRPDWNEVWSVHGDAEGNVWMGTSSGVQKLENNALKQVRYKDKPKRKMPVNSVFVNRKNQVWAGPAGGGVMRLEGDVFVSVLPPEPNDLFKRMALMATFEDTDGSLWLGSETGLWHLLGNKLRHYTPADGLPHQDIRCILRDTSGRLWLGTHGGGLSRFQGGVFRNFAEKDGLSHRQVHCLFEDSDRNLWVGTQLGLIRWKGDRGIPILTKNGLYDNCINHIQEDDNGRFWISCNRGIFSVAKDDLNGVVDGRMRYLNCTVYGEADGMLSNETNGEHQPSGWKGPDGRLWYPTQKGLAVVDPRDFRKKETPVPVVIEQVLAKGETIFDVLPAKPRSNQGTSGRHFAGALSNIRQLPAGAGETLEFHFAANTFVAPEKTRYRYMLENYDKEWRDAGPQRLAVYTNLRPGDYRFKVIACNYHGVWNQQPVLFAFTIAPYFHETPWFYALCSLGLLAVVLGIHHYRVRVVRRFQELQAQAALSDQRERIARDMHDDLGANLSRIALINEVVRRDGCDQTLLQRETAKIAGIAGQTVDSLSELVWATNPKYDTLENLVSYLREYSAQFFDQTTIQCQLTVPETIPPAQVDFKLRRHLFLVIKEALHNILKHSRADRAEVIIALPDSSIDITISDNGVGIGLSGSPAGNGLMNMRQRVDELQGTFEMQSSPAQGTILRMVVPLAR